MAKKKAESKKQKDGNVTETKKENKITPQQMCDWVRSQTVTIHREFCDMERVKKDKYLPNEFDTRGAIQLFKNANPNKKASAKNVLDWIAEQMQK